MNVGQLLLVVTDVTNGLRAIGVLNADGTFGEFTPEVDIQVAVLVESILKNYGVDIPTKTDKVIKLLGSVVSILD